MSPARAQTMTSGTEELRLTGWNPHTVCCQTPVQLEVVHTKRPHDCHQPEHPPMTVCAHDSVGLGRVVAPTRPRPGHPRNDVNTGKML